MTYEHSAAFYDARFSRKDYASESERVLRFLDAVHPRARTLLDVACGTGRHLEHLRSRYEVVGLDLDERLLRFAAERLPGVELHEGDMADFDLGRRLDVVTCLFASIGYMKSPDRMRAAVAAMARHLAPGGVLIVEPWLSPSAFRDDLLVHNLHSSPEMTMSWMYVQRRQGHLSVFDIHYLLGDPPTGVRHLVEHDELALYSAEEYAEAVTNAGLEPLWLPYGLHGYGLVVGRQGHGWVDDEVELAGRIFGRPEGAHGAS